jgi:hypothetical protein
MQIRLKVAATLAITADDTDRLGHPDSDRRPCHSASAAGPRCRLGWRPTLQLPGAELAARMPGQTPESEGDARLGVPRRVPSRQRRRSCAVRRRHLRAGMPAGRVSASGCRRGPGGRRPREVAAAGGGRGGEVGGAAGAGAQGEGTDAAVAGRLELAAALLEDLFRAAGAALTTRNGTQIKMLR